MGSAAVIGVQGRKWGGADGADGSVRLSPSPWNVSFGTTERRITLFPTPITLRPPIVPLFLCSLVLCSVRPLRKDIAFYFIL